MCALLSVLAAVAAPVVAVPASAAAAPAAVEEYDLALPENDGPQEPAPAPDPVPEPVPAPTPPAPAVPVAPTEAVAPIGPVVEAAVNEPDRKLDQAAARRDVLFEAPDQSTAPKAQSLAAPVERSSLPPTLWLLFGLGGACIVTTLVRLRRFAVALGTSPRPLPSSQT